MLNGLRSRAGGRSAYDNVRPLGEPPRVDRSVRRPRHDRKTVHDMQSPEERELAELIVQALNLDAVTPEQIDPEAPLFGTDLGLDSIDALEIALAVSKRYGFQLRSDNADNRKIFASLRALSAHVQQQRAN